jgi:hypothetical protein
MVLYKTSHRKLIGSLAASPPLLLLVFNLLSVPTKVSREKVWVMSSPRKRGRDGEEGSRNHKRERLFCLLKEYPEPDIPSPQTSKSNISVQIPNRTFLELALDVSGKRIFIKSMRVNITKKISAYLCLKTW